MLSDHYKLIPVDLRDVEQLDAILRLAKLDPRFVMKYFFTITVEYNSLMS